MISMRKLSPPCLVLSILLGYYLEHDLHEEVISPMPGAEHTVGILPGA